MKPGRDPLTLAELQRRFSDEDKCLAFLERARWPKGPVCPSCGTVNRASRITTRPGEFTCLDCLSRFSVTAGTPMHKTHLPLCTWIIATYLLATSSKGISSLKLASLLGLQYRTTWHLTRGIVELDETYLGGKPRPKNRPQPPAPVPLFEKPQPPAPPKKGRRPRKGGRGRPDKPMAFTIVERDGKARLAPVLSHGTADFYPLVRAQVHPSAVLATDELQAYIAIGRVHAGHITVNHSAEEFARDDEGTELRAHVNTAENVHSMFKRAIIGVWHQISGKHMGRYLHEVEFRWNYRGSF